MKFDEIVAKVRQDEELYNELKAIDNPERVVDVLRKHGYEISDDDLMEWVQAQATNVPVDTEEKTELDDDALDAVAGGVSFGDVAKMFGKTFLHVVGDFTGTVGTLLTFEKEKIRELGDEIWEENTTDALRKGADKLIKTVKVLKS